MTVSAKYPGAFADSFRVTVSADGVDFGSDRLWDSSQLDWARATGLQYLDDEKALTAFVNFSPLTIVMQTRDRTRTAEPHTESTSQTPWAPAWLHVLWDLTTERDAGANGRMVTSKRLDRWMVRKAVRDEAFRLALVVVYGEGGINAAADFVVSLAIEERFFAD